MGYIIKEEEGFEKGSICKVEEYITIGREAENTFQVFDDQASRVHAKIFVKENGFLFLEDLYSANGTFVNGKKVKKSILGNNDRIKIGNTLFVVKKLSQEEEESIESEHVVVSSSFTHSVTQINKLRCPKCFGKVEPGWKFCPECGANSRESN